MIPFFFIVETIKPEFLQSVHMGQISQRDANDLQAGMESKRKWSLLLLGACVIIFASTLAFAFWEKYLYFDDGTNMILIIGGFCLSFLMAVFQINKFYIAQTYLSALKHSRPGSVTNKHPLYNMDKLDQQLLDKISARKFTDAEARGLLNIANAARVGNKQVLMLAAALILAAVIFAIAVFHPMGFGIDDEFLSFFSVFMLAGSSFGFIVRFLRLGKNAQYISALRAKYPFLNEARW